MMLSHPINLNVASIDLTFDDINQVDELMKERVAALNAVLFGGQNQFRNLSVIH